MKIIPQNQVDAAFMDDLKDAISDRNATIDEVLGLIHKEGMSVAPGSPEKFALCCVLSAKISELKS